VVVISRFRPSEAFKTATLAAGTGEPDASSTVPEMVPNAAVAWPKAGAARTMSTTTRAVLRTANF